VGHSELLHPPIVSLGKPEYLESDDSPEFLLAVFKAWFLHRGIKPIQIDPVSPMEDE
jgi:hypothetical protein